MNETHDEPFLGPGEQALFAIEDTRERADALKAKLTPKLELILNEACETIRAIYGAESLDPYSVSLTPAHREKAKRTASFEVASAGLTVKGVAWFLQERIECSSSHLSTRLFGLRGREANPLVTVLRRHAEGAARLIEHLGCDLQSESFTAGVNPDELTVLGRIQHLGIKPDSEWCRTALEAWEQDLPVVDLESTWFNIYDFVALFPLFQSAANTLMGRPDRFTEMLEHFWEWDESINAEVTPDTESGDDASEADVYQGLDDPEEGGSAIEGEIVLALRGHRHRERRLRDAKIRQALRDGHGRLACEVPGCGFDFFEVYGEVGREFAIVHHRNPLSDRTEPELTELNDLAIVCANCHAMIHRGNDCRPLEGLIKGGRFVR